MPKIKVIGLGSPLRSDDGLGVEAIKRLAESETSPRAELIDGGLCGIGLLDLIQDADAIILVDAIQQDQKPPGTLIKIKPNQIQHSTAPPTSVHDLKIPEVLKMAKSLNINVPPITILGIVPENISEGQNLSKTVEKTMPNLISAIQNEMNNLQE